MTGRTRAAAAALAVAVALAQEADEVKNGLFSASRSVVVTNQAMGARCAVPADFDGDGRLGESH